MPGGREHCPRALVGLHSEVFCSIMVRVIVREQHTSSLFRLLPAGIAYFGYANFAPTPVALIISSNVVSC